MKVLKSALLGATILVGATVAASAADVYERGGSYKDTPAYVPVSTWAGFYAGIHAGSTFDDTIEFNNSNDVDETFVAGVHVGYNWQTASRWVLGVEASASFLDDEIQGVDLTDYLATIRGRVGYGFDRTLVYATGGVAFLGYNEDLRVNGREVDDTAVGFVVGGGIDHKINDKVSIGAEALYYSADAEVEGAGNDLERDFWTVQARLNYHFGSRHDEPLK